VLARYLTIAFIPHHSSKPVKVHFSFSFLLVSLLFWFSLTVWAVTLAIRHLDYWGIRLNNLALKAKTAYFAQEVKKSQEKLDEVKEIDLQLRQLLEMKSKKAIIEQDEATGGPSTADQENLRKLLQGKIQEVNQKDVENNIFLLNRIIKERMESLREITEYVQEQRSIYRATPNIWPVEGRITSFYGSRAHPWAEGERDFHPGLDIAAEYGTPVRATASGIVKLAHWEGGYGKLVVIDHGHDFITLYAHNSRLAVTQGDRVKRGQVIAYIGATGATTGAHLHYEVRIDGNAANPLRYVKK
ncbi:MAG TPA: hypothetical protein DHV62_00025, partial [Elusimicrobia bacterium]|nr:hypothetical protein [Elusimicrobiota bacterium]